MEKNKIYEELWREAQSVEVPERLSPEQLRQKLNAAPRHTATGAHAEKTEQKKKLKTKRFGWRGYGSRVAAAAVVLCCALGAFQIAALAPSAGDGQMLVAAGSRPDRQPSGGVDQEQPDVQDTEDAGTQAGVVTQLGEYRLADGYGELGTLLAQAEQEWYWNLCEDAAEGAAGSADFTQNKLESAVNEAASSDSARAEADDFSTTNLQVQGVDESDLVKTDGHYIYIADEEAVRIVDVSGGRIRQLGSIVPERIGNLDTIREMYLSDDRLILLVQSEQTGEIQVSDTEYAGAGARCLSDGARTDAQVCTRVLTYDVTSPAGARLIGTYEQDGGYRTSRKIGNDIYLVTGFEPYTGYRNGSYGAYYEWLEDTADGSEKEQAESETQTLTEQEVRQWLPHIQGEPVPADCIYLSERGIDSGLVLSAFDLTKPEQMQDCKLIFCGSAELYMTEQSMILYRSAYSEAVDDMCTRLAKFAVADGQITADSAESVRGTVEDTFAIHENANGYLYVLTTDGWSDTMQNRLYVLNEKLKIMGSLDHIADGERVYAARFVDEIGYFVTYRNTDPLFTVDFTDPSEPVLIGELEIPGFSDYLQFYDETHLIGVGEERVGEDSAFVGIKVSMYDISDPTDVKECAKEVLTDAEYAPAAYNYKALLAESSKGRVAFVTIGQSADADTSVRTVDTSVLTQQIFRVENGSFTQRAADPVETENAGLWELAENCRELYIGDRLYLVSPQCIWVYDLADDFRRLETCELR